MALYYDLPVFKTVMETDTRGRYFLYVHDYTNGGSSSSRALARSGAAVRVYGRDRLLHTFTVPENKTGGQVGCV
ncbi:MAG: hypothetical protein LBQ57_08165 [Spirochaetales bacterium]|jgi:hypothetical protein|nr:hypothetical protein [Spirochaetales bacterium]